MRWKILGKSVLVVTGFAAVVALLMWITMLHPWLFVTIMFIGAIAWVYSKMKQDADDIADNSRMSWNSDYDDEEEEK